MKLGTAAGIIIGLAFAGTACAQAAKSPAIAKNQPIEITSDTLDVHQDEHMAIFTGHVLAVQGTMNMKATQMTVYYTQADDKQAKAQKPQDDGGAQGISKIVAEGNVLFTTPMETAQGDTAIYTAATDTIDLTGSNVTLTREQNVLKGQKLNYNLSTGRSVLTGGTTAQSVGGGTAKPGRVHGLFVPKSDKK